MIAPRRRPARAAARAGGPACRAERGQRAHPGGRRSRRARARDRGDALRGRAGEGARARAGRGRRAAAGRAGPAAQPAGPDRRARTRGRAGPRGRHAAGARLCAARSPRAGRPADRHGAGREAVRRPLRLPSRRPGDARARARAMGPGGARGPRLRTRDPAGAGARAGALRHRLPTRHRAADLHAPRGRAVSGGDLRGGPRLAPRRRDPGGRAASAALRRLLAVLSPRGRGRRQGHPRDLPRAPVRQGGDVQLRRPRGLARRARADPGDRGGAAAGARAALQGDEHRRRRAR